jgi:hypothetical protein
VLSFVSIGTRRVEYIACTRNPDTAWVTQQARNLLMDLDDRRRSWDWGDHRNRGEARWGGPPFAIRVSPACDRTVCSGRRLRLPRLAYGASWTEMLPLAGMATGARVVYSVQASVPEM